MRPHEFFDVIKHVIGPQAKAERNPHPTETLRDALLRDTLSRALEGDDDSLQIVLDNVNTYVEIVHHTEYTPALMQCKRGDLFGQDRSTDVWCSCWIVPRELDKEDG